MYEWEQNKTKAIFRIDSSALFHWTLFNFSLHNYLKSSKELMYQNADNEESDLIDVCGQEIKLLHERC